MQHHYDDEDKSPHDFTSTMLLVFLILYPTVISLIVGVWPVAIPCLAMLFVVLVAVCVEYYNYNRSQRLAVNDTLSSTGETVPGPTTPAKTAVPSDQFMPNTPAAETATELQKAGSSDQLMATILDAETADLQEAVQSDQFMPNTPDAETAAELQKAVPSDQFMPNTPAAETATELQKAGSSDQLMATILDAETADLQEAGSNSDDGVRKSDLDTVSSERVIEKLKVLEPSRLWACHHEVDHAISRSGPLTQEQRNTIFDNYPSVAACFKGEEDSVKSGLEKLIRDNRVLVPF